MKDLVSGTLAEAATVARTRRQLLVVGLALLAFAISGTVYTLTIRRHIFTDFQIHAEVARQSLGTLQLPPHFLYFLILGACGLCTSGTATAILNAAVVILSCAVVAKWLVSSRIAVRELGLVPAAGSRGTPHDPLWALAVPVGLFLLLFAHSLPRTPLYFVVGGQPFPDAFSAYCFYAGRATATVWHNSTTVFAMPFALLLFYESSLLLGREPAARPWRLLALVALNIAAKPSFLIAMAPVLPLLVFVRHRFGWPFWLACGAVAFGALLLALQRWWLGTAPAGYGVRIDFLRVWGPYAPVFPLDLLASFAYPLLFAALFPRAARDRLYVYAAMLAAAAVLIGMTLCESPPFTEQGNFMWQVHTCCYVWFFATFVCHARDLLASRRYLRWRDVLVFGCLALHVLNGGAYLVRSLIIRTFI